MLAGPGRRSHDCPCGDRLAQLGCDRRGGRDARPAHPASGGAGAGRSGRRALRCAMSCRSSFPSGSTSRRPSAQAGQGRARAVESSRSGARRLIGRVTTWWGSARRGCRRRPRQFPTSSLATPPKELVAQSSGRSGYRAGQDLRPQSLAVAQRLREHGIPIRFHALGPAPTTGPTCGRRCWSPATAAGHAPRHSRARPVAPTGGSQRAMSGWGGCRLGIGLGFCEAQAYLHQPPWPPAARTESALADRGSGSDPTGMRGLFRPGRRPGDHREATLLASPSSGTGSSVRCGAMQPNLLEEWACRWLYRRLVAARDRACPTGFTRYYVHRTHTALGGLPRPAASPAFLVTTPSEARLFASHVQSAVDVDDLPGDVPRVEVGQELDHPGDLVRLAEAADRDHQVIPGSAPPRAWPRPSRWR